MDELERNRRAGGGGYLEKVEFMDRVEGRREEIFEREKGGETEEGVMICLRRCVCRARLEQFRTYRTVGRRAVLLEFVPNHRRFLSSGCV